MKNELRKQVIERALKGESLPVLAEEIGKDLSTIYRWMKKYTDGGTNELLKDKARSGRPKGSHKLDRLDLLKEIATTRPKDGAFWCASAVEGIVNTKVTRQTILNILGKFGISTLQQLRKNSAVDFACLANTLETKKTAKHKILYLSAQKLTSAVAKHTGRNNAILSIHETNQETHFRFLRLSGGKIPITAILQPLLEDKKKQRAKWAWTHQKLILVIADTQRLIEWKEFEAIGRQYASRVTVIKAPTKMPDFFRELQAKYNQ